MVFWMKMMLLLTALCMTLTLSSAQKLFFGSSHIQESAQEKQVSPKSFEVKAPLYFFKSRSKTNVEVTQKVTTVVICDNKTACPEMTTCCLIAQDIYGCCPFTEATCCLDRAHCCPFNMKCDIPRQVCIGNGISITWYEKTRSLTFLAGTVQTSQDRHVEHPSSLPCPDDSLHCADGLQCCKSSEGYSCCHHPDAKELPPISVGSVICPDGAYECPDGQTCCKLASGEWGCCPLPKAVCCSDGEHCCPHNTTCDVSEGKCLKGDTVMDWYEKVAAVHVESVICPDGAHECPDGQTCCKLASGDWGCCPLPKAVCCSDGEHCCPHNTTCDVSEGKCLKGDTVMDWYEKVAAVHVESVICPDGAHECPDGQTCCKLASGDWGCCPLPKAVCCSDGEHCCPHNTTCDVSEGKCLKGDTVMDWYEKVAAVHVESVICPDGAHECPDGQTCCKLASGDWGCCPLPKAVCCSDGEHCCPHNTTCDVSEGKCLKGDTVMDWYEKVQATNRIKDIVCPDGSLCEDGQTCCPMGDANINSYGCCPLPNAVCCSDGQHCCPQGYHCNLQVGMCVRGFMRRPWFQNKRKTSDGEMRRLQEVKTNIKTFKGKDESKVNVVVCPDQKVTCPDQYTCCSNGKGSFSCCPMPQGICCANHAFCCPHGYVCDEEPGICRIAKVSRSLASLLKTISTKKKIQLI